MVEPHSKFPKVVQKGVEWFKTFNNGPLEQGWWGLEHEKHHDHYQFGDEQVLLLIFRRCVHLVIIVKTIQKVIY